MQIYPRLPIHPAAATQGHLLLWSVLADPTFQGTTIEKAKILQVHILASLIARGLRCQNLYGCQQHSPVPPSPAKAQQQKYLA